MFNSPLGHCVPTADYVELDQTQEDCAKQHRCHKSTTCPLSSCFCDPGAKPPDTSIGLSQENRPLPAFTSRHA